MRDHGPAPKEKKQSEFPTWLQIAANLTKAYANAQGTKRKHEDAENRAANWTAGATVAIAFFTFVSIGIGIAQWLILSGTLAEMREEQRPWVYPEIVISGPLMFKNGGFDAKLDISKFIENAQNFRSPPRFNSMLPVKLVVKNVGKLPALNVFASAKLAFGSHFLSIDNVNGQLVHAKAPGLTNDDIKGQCRLNKPRTEDDVFGTVVFSGQPDAFFDVTAVGNADRSPDTGYIRLVACVTYYFSGSTTLHTTIFFFDIDVDKARTVGDTIYFDEGGIKLKPSLILNRAS